LRGLGKLKTENNQEKNPVTQSAALNVAQRKNFQRKRSGRKIERGRRTNGNKRSHGWVVQGEGEEEEPSKLQKRKFS